MFVLAGVVVGIAAVVAWVMFRGVSVATAVAGEAADGASAGPAVEPGGPGEPRATVETAA